MHIVELDAEHPGFHDPEYRRRRDQIARIALTHDHRLEPPKIEYTARERETWATVYKALVELHPTHACREYNSVFSELAYDANAIPQLANVSDFLTERTGFRLQPVAGLVSPRDFLTALSRRVFCSTQYIRHHSRPHYTPEPDLVHELMGHAPMLAIRDFADLSQKIGEGACKANDQQIEQLATLYWYTIEYGVVMERGRRAAYGAGLLSSFGELKRALSGDVQIRRFDPDQAKDVPYPITTYQPLLWEVGSIREAFESMDGWLKGQSLSEN